MAVTEWTRGVTAITLFVEDLPQAKEFYARAFATPVHFEDADSAVFDFGNTLINLLVSSAVPELIDPAPMAGPTAGSRMQLTLTVDDVDAVVKELQARGVELLNGPVDRPWGIRTASFKDPAGHIWEIAAG